MNNICFLCNNTKEIYTPAKFINWENNVFTIIKEDQNGQWMNVYNCPICSENKPYIIKFD